MAWWPGGPHERVGERLAPNDGVDGRLRDVDGGARRLPGPGADEGHRVVAVAPGRGVDGGRLALGQPVEHARRRHEVGDDAVLARGAGRPARPSGRARCAGARRAVGRARGAARRRRAVGVDAPVPGRAQRVLDARRTLRQLGARGAHPYPDLGGRDVQQARVAPHHDGASGHAEASQSREPWEPSRRRAPCWGRMRAWRRLLTWEIRIGSLPTGPTNSVVDVPGVGLGHATVVHDDPPPPVGRGVARTGVTVVDLGGDAWARPVVAGVAVLNGVGELTARSQIDESGLLETPVFLTSTMQVGRVYDAACRLLMAEQPSIGVDDVIIPVVGECDDSWLNDARRMHVTDEHVAAALARRPRLRRHRRAARAGCRRRGHGHVVLRLQGRHRDVVAGPARRARGRRRPAHQLRAWDRLTVDGVAVGRALGASGARDAAARRFVPGRRRHRRTARPQRVRAARRGASASGSAAPGRWPRTARVRSSSPRRSGCARRADSRPSGRALYGSRPRPLLRGRGRRERGGRPGLAARRPRRHRPSRDAPSRRCPSTTYAGSWGKDARHDRDRARAERRRRCRGATRIDPGSGTAPGGRPRTSTCRAGPGRREAEAPAAGHPRAAPRSTPGSL